MRRFTYRHITLLLSSEESTTLSPPEVGANGSTLTVECLSDELIYRTIRLLDKLIAITIRECYVASICPIYRLRDVVSNWSDLRSHRSYHSYLCKGLYH